VFAFNRWWQKALHCGVVVALASSLYGANDWPDGRVCLTFRTDPTFDSFLQSPMRRSDNWLRTYVWRMMVYSPFFDNKLEFFPNGWVYINLYGLHKDWPVVAEHPEWILRDSAGNALYIPYECANGTCPLYAADVSNPQYRSHWLTRAKSLVSKGYRGLWIDDVNLEFRVSDGNSQQVAPVDRNTGKPMLYDDWKRYVADFTTQIRTTLPGVELLHNAIWYAGGPNRDADANVKRELMSADFINIERGVADSGLTGGDGQWSLHALLDYVDRLHALGKGVIMDNSKRLGEYGLAAYFLISNGGDGVGSHDIAPGQVPREFGIDLGPSLGQRTYSKGLFRREFQRGVVLLVEPGGPATAPTICDGCIRLDGSPAAGLTLRGGEAAIVMRSEQNFQPFQYPRTRDRCVAPPLQ
jgi:hypothetical protein